VLTKVPWDQYDSLTLGSFTDWKPRYEAADPVFFWFQADIDLPFVHPGPAQQAGMMEMKLPRATWRDTLPGLGLDVLNVFHDRFVDPVWAALALAAPAALPVDPRSSISFLMPAGGRQHIELSGAEFEGVRVQGDADQELVFLADATSTPLTDVALARTAELCELTERVFTDEPDSSGLMRRLLGVNEITLAPHERSLLAVTDLEDLLLPDVVDAPGDTLARRVANLLGGDEERRTVLRDIARNVYRQRSSVVHGNAGAAAPAGDLPPEAAVQLLAGAVLELARTGAGGDPSVDLLARLDQEPTGTGTVDIEMEPATLAAAYRLGPLRPWSSATWSSSGNRGLGEDTLWSWSPLIDLGLDGGVVVDNDLPMTLTSMDAEEIVSMEEKDIRRDFIAKLRLEEPVAALATSVGRQDAFVDDETVALLTRRRDLAVAGLRMCGFSAFIDPELLGWYMYHGLMRSRRETVLRQSVLMAMGTPPPVRVGPGDAGAVLGSWKLVARYDAEARDPAIDRTLDLYRRAHDRRFIPTETRAVLAVICLESLLGEFRPKKSGIQFEDCVGVLDDVPREAVAWCTSEGRQFRNLVAHGSWHPEPIEQAEIATTDHPPVAHLLAITGAAVRTLLPIWLESEPRVRTYHGPSKLLVRAVGERLA
ncbi:MAG: hypothetical protein WBV06_14300, partial [Acidimicrobiia bacterium]